MENITNFKEALQKFNLDWKVEKRPIFTVDNNGNQVEVRNSKAIVRKDNDNTLGVVSNRYSVIQNDDFTDLFDEVVRNTGASYISGGMFDGGEKIYVQAKLPSNIVVNGNDEINKILTLIASHDSSSADCVGFTGIRVVCLNTFWMAAKSVQKDRTNSVKVRHSSSAQERLVQAKHIMAKQLGYFEEVELQVRWLAEQKFSDLQMKHALHKVFNVKDGEKTPTRTENAMNTVMSNFISGTGIDSTNRGTAWAAWNAFTEYSNHQAGVRNADERGGQNLVRFESVLLGGGAAFNQQSLDAIQHIIVAS